MNSEHNGPLFLAPRDLSITPIQNHAKRVLVIGSCMIAGLPLAIKNSPYESCEADFVLFNNAGDLPASPPQPINHYGLQIIQIPLRSVMPEGSYFRAPYADEAFYKTLFEECVQRLELALENSLRWNTESGILSFVANFMVPQQNPMGKLLPRYDLRNFVYFTEELNKELYNLVSRRRNVHMLDVDKVSSIFGKKYYQDDSVWMLAHGASLNNNDYEHDRNRIQPVEGVDTFYTLQVWDYVLAIWSEIVSLYRIVHQIDPIKLVVVDLDDTLWRGVAADTDDHAVPTLEGWPMGFIEALHFLKNRGVLITIVSKNTDEVIKKLWRRQVRNLIAIEDFAIHKINWQSKAENIREIMAEANLLPRNVLFIDDNPVERNAVKAEFPDIRVIGDNQYLTRRILLWSAETQVPSISQESSRRTEMIQAQVERESTRKSLSKEEFIASLNIEKTLIVIRDVDHPRFARSFELLNKTNQFNTTGRRWRHDEIAALLAAGGAVYACEVSDRYSDYGLIGVGLVSDGQLLQFVMSCRVIGLEVETWAIGEIVSEEHRNGRDVRTAAIVETDANFLSRDLFARCGWSERSPGLWLRPGAPAEM